MATQQTCHLCGSPGDTRPCERCKRHTCQPCCIVWREWGSNFVHFTAATCRPCFLADLWRDVAEAREEAGDAEMAPSFEQLGL